jgi:two-component system, chemotaxis family, protein-glutamate methylesterase/glutaminase
VESPAQPRTPPVVVIGASAGGVEALVKLVGGLTTELGAAVVVVLHLPATGTSVLPEILRRSGVLPVMPAGADQPLEANQITVAPPDHHVLVVDGRLVLDRGPRENGCRPAADPLFRSAARSCHSGVIGVVLSGSLDDGVSGLRAIKDAGGIAVVQDPNDALTPSMPAMALANVPVDHVVPADAIAPLLVRLSQQLQGNPTPMADTQPPSPIGKLPKPSEMPGWPTPLTCPECGGVIWEAPDGEVARFRCNVGHSFSAESMLELQSDSVETALWTALRVLEERADLLRRLADHQRESGNEFSARGFELRAREVSDRAEVLRHAIARSHGVAAPVDKADVTT